MPFSVINEYSPFHRKKVAEGEFDGQKVVFNAGCYLMYGATSVGKSVSALSLGIALGATGSNSVTYAHCNEATGNRMNLMELLKFVNDTSDKRMMIVDSITLIMLLATEGLKNPGPTFKGGLSGAHIDTLSQMQTASQKQNVALLAVINNELFPVADLEGAVEGSVRIPAKGMIEKRDRTRRSFQAFKLPMDAVLSAHKLLEMELAGGSAEASDLWSVMR